MALTAFGKALRKFRIDRDLTLREMAEKIGVTSSLLSSVETGRKKISKNLLEGIKDYLNELHEPVDKFIKLADLANKSISLKNIDEGKQRLIVEFARTEMTAEELKKFQGVLESIRKG